MAINLKIDTATVNALDASQIHFIPAEIKGDGPAKVESYFNAYTVEKDKVLENAMRGYPLKGYNFPVPKEYRGVVFEEAKKPVSLETERTFKATGMFNEFTYWNWDKVPSKNDTLQRAMDWIEISKTIHCCDSDDEVTTPADE